MSLKVLELDTIELTCPTDNLKLSVVPKIHFRVPSTNLASLDAVDLVKALTSGKVWVTRGRAFGVSVHVSFNGKLLDGKLRPRILEALGYHLRDADLWTKLSLSPSLRILQPADARILKTHIVISINSSTSLSTTDVHPRGWLLDNVDIQPPECIPCAKFESLEIRLEFRTLREASQLAASFKSAQDDIGSMDTMLLDCFTGPKANHRLEELEQVVDKLSQNLSSTISSLFSAEDINQVKSNSRLVGPFHQHPPPPTCYGPVHGNTTKPPWRNVTETEWKLTLADESAMLPSIEHLDISVPRAAKGEKKLSKSSIQFLEEPLSIDDTSHSYHMLLLQATKLLSSEEEPMSFTQTFEAPSITPALSQSSTLSAESTKSSFGLSNQFLGQKSGSTDLIHRPILQTSTINTLTSTAMHIIVTGSTPRPLGAGIGVKIQATSTKLPSLVPSMFLPGFKQIISHNAKFLPTLSNALCSSMVRNVQGPGLRGKLVELSKAAVSEYNDTEHQDIGSVERLAAVVQSRVWAMMQRRLVDLDSWRKLKSKKGKDREPENDEEVEDEDLLGEITQESADMLPEAGGEDTQGGIEDHDEEQFEDLLFGIHSTGDNEGLLHYFEQEEQRLVEMETDEMLFGGEEDAEEEGLLLGDGYSDADGMLLDP